MASEEQQPATELSADLESNQVGQVEPQDSHVADQESSEAVEQSQVLEDEEEMAPAELEATGAEEFDPSPVATNNEGAEEASPVSAPPAATQSKAKKKGRPKVPVDPVKALEFTIKKTGGAIHGAPGVSDESRLELALLEASGYLGRASTGSLLITPVAAVNVDMVRNSLEADRQRHQRGVEAMQQRSLSLRQSQERFCKPRTYLVEGEFATDDAFTMEAVEFGAEDEEDEEWQRLMEEEEAKELELCKWFPSVRKSAESRRSVRESARKSRFSVTSIGLKQIVHEWLQRACEKALLDREA